MPDCCYKRRATLRMGNCGRIFRGSSYASGNADESADATVRAPTEPSIAAYRKHAIPLSVTPAGDDLGARPDIGAKVWREASVASGDVGAAWD
jgi:hypothetical protein